MSKVHPQQLVQLVRWLRDHGAHGKSGVSWFRSDGPRIDWNGKFETPETLVLFAFSDVPWWFPVSLPLKSSHWAFQREQHSSRCSRGQGLDISHRGTSHRKDPKPLWVAWQQGLYPMNCHVGNPGIIFGNWLVVIRCCKHSLWFKHQALLAYIFQERRWSDILCLRSQGNSAVNQHGKWWWMVSWLTSWFTHQFPSKGWVKQN